MVDSVTTLPQKLDPVKKHLQMDSMLDMDQNFADSL